LVGLSFWARNGSGVVGRSSLLVSRGRVESMADIVGVGIFEAGLTVLLTTAVSGIVIVALLKLHLFNNEAGHPS
jgi:hypothetical protein